MSPASVAPVSTAAKPSSRACSRDARVRARRPEAAGSRCAVRGIEQRAQIVEAFARRQRQRVRARLRAALRSIPPRRSPALRGDSIRRSRLPRRGRAALRPSSPRPPSPRKITTRLPATSCNSGNASRPSLSNVVAGIRHVGDAGRGERRRRAGTGRKRQQRGRPRVGRRHAIFGGVGGDEDRDVVLVERRVRAIERTRDSRAAGSRSPERRSAWRRAPPAAARVRRPGARAA